MLLLPVVLTDPANWPRNVLGVTTVEVVAGLESQVAQTGCTLKKKRKPACCPSPTIPAWEHW